MMEEWKTLTFGDVCSRITDGAHNSPPSVPEGKPMASVKDLTPFGIRLDSCRRVSDGDYERLVRQGCKPTIGDVLISKDGATALDTVCEFKCDVDVVLLSSVAILSPNPSIINSSYLRYYLDSSVTRSYLKASFISGAAIPRIVLKDLKRAAIRVPPMPIQIRIAGILSAYDELIENNQRRIRILEEMARSLYREWFVHFRYPGHEAIPLVDSPLGPIPKGWEVKAFTDVADVLSGGTPKTRTHEFWNGEIPFFTPRDAPTSFYVQHTDKHLTEAGLSKCSSKLYEPDTVFITARGTVGKVAMPSKPMAMNQSCYALKGKAGISQRFLFLMTLRQVDYLKTNTGGATFDTIIVDTFRQMKVAQPLFSQVEDFTCRINPIFEQVNTLEQQTANLRHTRDLLLPKLLSGDIGAYHHE